MCGAPLLIKPAERTFVASEAPSQRETKQLVRDAQPIPPTVVEATRFSEYPTRSNRNGRQAEGEPAEPQREREETTVSGPSFLGLSGSETPSSSSGYSYLFQDEPEKSHTGLYVFLFLLIIGGAVLYWKWQPVRDYVVSTAIAHSQRPKPAAEEQASAPAEDAGHTPAPSVDVAPGAPKPADAAKTDNPPPTTPDKNAKSDTTTPEAAAASDKTTQISKAQETGATTNTGKAGGAEKPSRTTRAASADSAAAADTKSADTPEAATGRPSARSATQKLAPARAAQAVPGAELVQAGERFLYGRGVPKNCGQAVNYFRAAAGQQNPQAFSHLGALYTTGECVPMDKAQAYSWFSRALAAQHSNPYIERNLTMLWRDMTPQERQRVAGRTY
jgi:hypothetical protein